MENMNTDYFKKTNAGINILKKPITDAKIQQRIT